MEHGIGWYDEFGSKLLLLDTAPEYGSMGTYNIIYNFHYAIIVVGDQKVADKIKCSHILVKKQSEAISVLERLKKGESFTNLAKELSIDKGSAKKGGDLGLFGRGMMVKPFEEAAFKLNKGEVTSEPVKTEFGYHIIKRAG